MSDGFERFLFFSGVALGFCVGIWVATIYEQTQDRPVCVEYSQSTGDCVREMTVEELINNANQD